VNRVAHREVAVPEDDVRALAGRLAELTRATPRDRLRRRVDVNEILMAWAVARPTFKVPLFRFIDALPACRDPADVLDHLEGYLDVASSPVLVRTGLHVAAAVPGGANVAAAVAHAGVRRMAKRFIAGQSAADAAVALEALWRDGFAATVDLLGEKTVTLADADHYAGRVAEMLAALTTAATTWPEDRRLEVDAWSRLPPVNISIKASAVAPLLTPYTLREGIGQAMSRLGPVLDHAQVAGATIHLDSEHDEVKDATFALLREIGRAYPDGPQLGCVVQAYRTDAYDDLRALIEWSATTLRRPLQIRLVKGAYWDAETIIAQAHRWAPPVWQGKPDSDANYERCARLMVERAGDIRPAFASHNLRSLAYALTATRHAGLPESAVECQVLYGMATPLHGALRDLGYRTRVYVPIGELVPGMAYLVRRLLENTSNDSFVRISTGGEVALDALVARPESDLTPPGAPAVVPTDPDDPGPFVNEPEAELRRPQVRQRLVAAVAATATGFAVPIRIGGDERVGGETLVSVDPGRTDREICRSALATTSEAERAVETAHAAFGAWAAEPARQRAGVLFRAAALLRQQRDTFVGLMVLEAGKPLAEADAEICEAIDFCEYYGRAALRLAEGGTVLDVAGEANRLTYQQRGVAVVISPWNFPLAIPMGMVTAQLVTGNTVVFKPAEQTPGIAWRMAQVLNAAGVPDDVLAFLPGVGEEVGPALVEHPLVTSISFTGSRAVGLDIIERAAVVRPGQRHVKRVVAEMGGKNAIVVDTDADLDEAIPAIVHSAFSYAGQKCSAASRLIVLRPVLEELVDRLAGAVELVVIGHPSDPATKVGPLIDADALRRVERYQALAQREAEVVVHRKDIPDGGWYAGPMLCIAGAQHPLARDEIFGPVLTVLAADDLDHAIALANDTDYALTAGAFSRSPAAIERLGRELRAGNVYINRHIVGAVVGRQPFGGYGLSGVGSKAGGPDYLHQLVDPRVVTENTMRQGFEA
jgi:RHH-type transcriptional regulator, proline utilization regulon repressor / proline dehydrogenase / delta 1-pyrroline-5-carboxylate dehydrogenase